MTLSECDTMQDYEFGGGWNFREEAGVGGAPLQHPGGYWEILCPPQIFLNYFLWKFALYCAVVETVQCHTVINRTQLFDNFTLPYCKSQCTAYAQQCQKTPQRSTTTVTKTAIKNANKTVRIKVSIFGALVFFCVYTCLCDAKTFYTGRLQHMSDGIMRLQLFHLIAGVWCAS